MRGYIGLVLLLWILAAHAGNAGSATLRVGSQVLVVGDSAARAIELLGKPSYKGRGKAAGKATGKTSGKASRKSTAHGRSKGSKPAADTGGEQWQYLLGGRQVSVMIVDGRVAAIRDGGR
ncbi:DUF2845 domain-containing protein [Dyella sp. 20L07]|uniref:DUF2845 domain-containing protein n=1 Tax=Dyella sp. 20L07 TaxID=3384240 RepID=UPI003D269223